MSDALTNRESLVRAAVENRAPTGAISDEIIAAGRIRKVMSEQDPEKALKSMQVKPIDQSKITAAHEKNISMSAEQSGLDRRNDKTGLRVRRGKEAQRFTEVTETTTLVNKYLKEFANLNTADQDVIIDKISPVLEASLPFADTIFNTPGADAHEMVRALLNDPEYALKLQDLLEQHLSQNPIEQMPEELREKVEEIERKIKEKEADQARITNERTDLGTKLDTYNPNAGAGTPGDELSRILPTRSDLENQIQGFKREESTKKAEINNLNVQLAVQQDLAKRSRDAAVATDAAEQVTRILGEISTKQSELTTAISEREEREAKLKRREELESERNSLQTKADQMQKDWNNIAAEIDQLKREFHIAQGDLNEFRLSRVQQELDYVNKINGVFGETALQYYQDRIQKANEAAQKLLEEDKKNAKDAIEQNFLDNVKGRYDHPPVFDRKGRFKEQKPNEATITADWRTVVSDGPEGLIRARLVAQGLTTNQIDEKMKDEEFVVKAKNAIVVPLIQKKVQLGQFTAAEAEFLANSEWALPAIENATARNQQAKERLAKLVADGVVKRDLSSWVKENPKKIGILLLILAGIISGAALVSLAPAAGIGVTALSGK